MATKAIITRVLYTETNAVNGNLLLFWEVQLVGPEIAIWSGNDWKSYVIMCTIETDGTDTLSQLGTKLTDCAVNGCLNSTGIVILRSNVYLPSYAKGI